MRSEFDPFITKSYVRNVFKDEHRATECSADKPALICRPRFNLKSLSCVIKVYLPEYDVGKVKKKKSHTVHT